MPAVAFELAECLEKRGVTPKDEAYDIFLANNYEAGQYTANHTDAKYILRPLIVTSLLSEGEIVFGRHLASDGGKTRAYKGSRGCPSLTLTLPPRSTIVLEGKAADVAQHAINTVKQRRISILLRKTHLQANPATRKHPTRPS